MGKFNMNDNRSQLKEIVREMKEKAAEKDKEKDAASNLKRIGFGSTQTKKPNSNKKMKTPVDGDRVEPEGGQSTLPMVVDGSFMEKGKEIVQGAEKGARSSSYSVKLKSFIDDVVQAFARPSSEKPTSPLTDSQKFRLTFNQSAMALYAQREMICKFESLEGPLREYTADLVKQLGDSEDEVESANAVISKRDESIARMEAHKKEAEVVIEVLRSDLASVQRKNEVETEKLHDQIVGLHGKIEQLSRENAKLKMGEGVDLEAVIDSDEFAEIKECMDDAVANRMISRITEAHPEWDISFLTEGGVDPSSSEIDQSNGQAGEKRVGVDPIDGGKTRVDSELEGGPV